MYYMDQVGINYAEIHHFNLNPTVNGEKRADIYFSAGEHGYAKTVSGDACKMFFENLEAYNTLCATNLYPDQDELDAARATLNKNKFKASKISL